MALKAGPITDRDEMRIALHYYDVIGNLFALYGFESFPGFSTMSMKVRALCFRYSDGDIELGFATTPECRRAKSRSTHAVDQHNNI
jgi:hypothetical protein